MLKQAADSTPVGEVCRKAGISDATFYNWRKNTPGLMPSEMKRLRQLEGKPTVRLAISHKWLTRLRKLC
ncbi:IS3 family insertion sequence transposase domain-containing protein (plasmid) [Rhizobium etli]|uniref:IS3 family insertion sequence transposase domain-containing protein n=1 Tax=Rhizobium etli TaxID=29449 RepID=A0AAN1BLM5_RHIET|nr:IS3 family insertion sequence transposase domain-containing protein [Rhizobium etli]